MKGSFQTAQNKYTLSKYNKRCTPFKYIMGDMSDYGMTRV